MEMKKESEFFREDLEMFGNKHFRKVPFGGKNR